MTLPIFLQNFSVGEWKLYESQTAARPGGPVKILARWGPCEIQRRRIWDALARLRIALGSLSRFRRLVLVVAVVELEASLGVHQSVMRLLGIEDHSDSSYP